MPLSANSTFLSSSATRPAAANSACPRSHSLSTQRSTWPRQPPLPGLPTRKFLENNRPAISISRIDLQAGRRTAKCLEGRLALSFAKTGYRIAQTADDALLAENDHGVEERRRH